MQMATIGLDGERESREYIILNIEYGMANIFKPGDIRYIYIRHSLFHSSIPIFFIKIDAFKLVQMPSFNR